MGDKRSMLGILGGMGPQATNLLYQMVIDRTPAKCDQDHIPTLIYSDAQMPDRTSAIVYGNDAEVRARLVADAKLLASCGCSYIAIPCNTAHYFADDVQEQAGIPVLHMPRLTVAELAKMGKRKAAVLATVGTVTSGVYHRELVAAGIEPWAPDPSVQVHVTSIIYDQIKAGQCGDPADWAIIEAAARESGCDCAILGCTELSVYGDYHQLDRDFYIDPMAVLAQACVDACTR
ncbi:MAG: amino acid racemase [Coriobacteriales bacterium]|nr:amino acid racemase [Coriobacteriales bacterium]